MISILFIDHYSRVAERFVSHFMNKPEKPFFTIIDPRFDTLVKPILTSKCKKLFCLERMLNFYSMSLGYLALTISAIILKNPDWREVLQKGLQTNTIVITDGFDLEKFDIEKPNDFLRILSWQLTQSMENLKTLLRKHHSVLDPICVRATKYVSDMLDKTIGQEMLEDMNKTLEEAIQNNSKKPYLDLIRMQIEDTKKNIEENTESIEHTKNQFILYIQMIAICTYALFCEDIIDQHSKDENYLIIVHKDFYNYFTSIISLHWKRFRDKIRLYRDFNDIEDNGKIKSESLRDIENKIADDAAKEILEEEEREKQKKEEAERKKIEKQKLRKLKEDEIKKRKKILNSVRPITEVLTLTHQEEKVSLSKPEVKLVSVVSPLKLPKQKPKLNPTVPEFIPVKIPSDIQKYIKTDQDLFHELTIFRQNPSWYLHNQNAFLFFTMEMFPEKFRYQDIQAYHTMKNEMVHIWQNIIQATDYCVRDMTFCNFRAIEQSLIFSMQV